MFERSSTLSNADDSSAISLLGKTALVTGASRGIGASVARQLGAVEVDVAINIAWNEQCRSFHGH